MNTETDDRLLGEALDLGIRKALRDGRKLDAFPHVTRDGRWLISEHGRWTAGFFVGMLWIGSLAGGVPADRELAVAWTRRLAFRAKDRSTHDMGFLFEPSFVRAHKITGSPEFRDVAVEAARSLASRFHPQGCFIPAWSPQEDPAYAGLAIVDTIMNVPLLLWASQQAGDGALWDVGLQTALTIAEQHVRPDGSTWHTVDHDPAGGTVTAKGTHQGAAADSCWSRGQAWALSGFAKVGAIAASPELLTIACRLADYFLERLGTRVLPPWDFDRDGEGEPRDSAAAAVAASGLLDLGRATGQAVYAEAGRRLAVGLARTCIDFADPDRDGLVLHGTVDVPRQSGIDQSIMYGDHYFMEAALKILRPETSTLLGCLDAESKP